jgi:hypothetical protein
MLSNILHVCVYYCSTYYKAVSCVFITAVPMLCVYYSSAYYKAVRVGDIGGHVLRETTSRGLCGLVCPSRTSERGGEGDCVKGGGGGEGKLPGLSSAISARGSVHWSGYDATALDIEVMMMMSLICSCRNKI